MGQSKAGLNYSSMKSSTWNLGQWARPPIYKGEGLAQISQPSPYTYPPHPLFPPPVLGRRYPGVWPGRPEEERPAGRRRTFAFLAAGREVEERWRADLRTTGAADWSGHLEPGAYFQAFVPECSRPGRPTGRATWNGSTRTYTVGQRCFDWLSSRGRMTRERMFGTDTGFLNWMRHMFFAGRRDPAGAIRADRIC
jgi:hypothetical protein